MNDMEKLGKRKNRLKYQAVHEKIGCLIEKLEGGDKLPSERVLADKLGCSFLTVRKAMGVLVDEGRVVRRPGSGSFVSGKQGRENCKAVFGLMMSSSTDSYGLRIIEEISKEAERREFSLSSVIVNDFTGAAIYEAENLQKNGCQALLLPWYPAEKVSEVSAFVHESPLPVCLPQYIPGLEHCCFEEPSLFGVNLIKSIENICRYFYKQGYRQIMYLGHDQTASEILQKNLAGYNMFVCNKGLPNLCALLPSDTASMDELARNLCRHRGDLGVVCYDDDHALRLIIAMHKLGMSAPEDFVITGIGNGSICRFSDPPLSSVYQDFEYSAHWMLRNALALSKGSTDQSSELPKMRFVARESCGGKSFWEADMLFKELEGCGFIAEVD